MNQRGYSWPETILTLAVLVVIFGTLLPLATKVTLTLHEKKLAMHAIETAYHGAIVYRSYDLAAGIRQIDGTDFDWHVTGNSICVFYNRDDKETTRCVGF